MSYPDERRQGSPAHHLVVSKDGKTLGLTGEGTNTLGKRALVWRSSKNNRLGASNYLLLAGIRERKIIARTIAITHPASKQPQRTSSMSDQGHFPPDRRFFRPASLKP